MAKTKIIGKVVSTIEKTARVLNEYKIKHPIYLKTMRKSKNYLVHDGQSIAKVGQTVEIIETCPISKNKHFEISRIIEEK